MLVIGKGGHVGANTNIPIKVWLEGIDDLEPECREQAENLANLPFAHHHIALMPDTHTGFGMPIGGVLAAEDVVVPNAVGVDVGCGMRFCETDVPAGILREIKTGSGTLAQLLTGQIMRNIPVGFAHHKEKQPCSSLDAAEWIGSYPEDELLIGERDKGYYQIGTLGGGNHFIELQSNNEGRLCVMLHSGSRNFGFRIANYYNAKAEELNSKWGLDALKKQQLSFLPIDHKLGQGYLRWMSLALEFARENRCRMMSDILRILKGAVEKYASLKMTVLTEIDCHHNYVALEEHFKKQVWVHRKGAIRAGMGDIGIIPGAMGVHSYLVEGLGNEESFLSCSHGAGRRMSRKAAKDAYKVDEVMSFFKSHDIVLGKRDKSDAADEFFAAYKNLDTVMANQTDLVKIVDRLQNAGVVIKG